MKRIGILSTTVILFLISLYSAYLQGMTQGFAGGTAGTHLAAFEEKRLPMLLSEFVRGFAWLLSRMTELLGGSLVAAVIVLALLVELVTLYPAVSLQLIQKKIHLFHKKLVDRFARGELSVSHTRHELEILYSVNERMHRQGAWLFASQFIVFLLVLIGLYFTARIPSALPGAYTSFKLAMLSRPEGLSLPFFAGIAYLLHSLVRIYLKQREDYIDPKQIYAALGFGLISAGLVFYFSGTLAVLVTVYFLTQITFSTMRVILVEEEAQAWGKKAQRELIHLLRTSELHKNRLEHWSRKFHHLPIIRHLNFHFLEEAISMSFGLFIAMSAAHFM